MIESGAMRLIPDRSAALWSGALVWGFAEAGAVVSCTVDTSSVVSATADKTGRWELVLQQKGGAAAHTLVFATSSVRSLTSLAHYSPHPVHAPFHPPFSAFFPAFFFYLMWCGFTSHVCSSIQTS